jgi:hypothetical protein
MRILYACAMFGGLVACGDKDDSGGGGTSADADNDGYEASVDCDDEDPGVHPDATESCDEVDQDCDELVDEGVAATWYADSDGDGYGDPGNTTAACSTPDGYTSNSTDCDDTSSAVRPGATEACDELDNDCDLGVDEGTATEIFYADEDEDGYGDPENNTRACTLPEGYTTNSTDCDDDDPDTHPGAPEVYYDGIDQDCNGGGDNDQDGDGYAWEGDGGSDCDDTDPEINPSAAEICNDGVDNNCDGAPGACGITGALSATDADATLSGESSGSYTGVAMEIVPDMDGDGDDELLIGAPAVSTSGAYSGAAYLVLGPITADMNLSSADATLSGGATYDYLGYDVNTAGDVNGDGYGDVLTASFLYPSGGYDGGVWLFEGPLSGDYTTRDAVAWMEGSSAAYLGYDVSGAGDVDGDGYGDLVIGEPYRSYSTTYSGVAWFFYGPVSGELTEDSADAWIAGPNTSSFMGVGVSSAGDLDGDGMDELLVGAPLETSGGVLVGAVYAFSGLIRGSVSVSDADLTVYGVSDTSQFGFTARSAGDTDGDGSVDILVGANTDGTAGYQAGGAHLFTGPLSGTLSTADAAASFYAEAAGDFAGEDIAGDFDLNADGRADIGVGSSNASVGEYAGRVYIFYSPVGGVVSLGDADASVDGASSSDYANRIASGDLDGDGVDDLAVGAYGAGSSSQGEVYLFFGELGEL